MTVHVWVIVTAGRRSGLIRHATTRRRTSITSITPVVELAGRCASAIVIATRAVATRWPATVVVIIVGRRWVSATAAAHGRAGSVSITAPVIRTTGASVRSARFERWRWGRIGDVLDTGNFLPLELTTVQLLHCGLQVGGRLILDESSAITLAANFRVDDVQSRLAGKVFEVLPAGLHRKIRYSHPVWCAPRTRGNALVGSEVLVTGTRAASELDDEALAHEVGTMECRDNITSVHCVLVLDEAKSVHELDLSDLTSAMRLEVALDICLGGIARKVA
jgi:hypothetical protein